MDELDLGHQILKTIKDKRIKPKPKWEFILKNYSLWVLAMLSLTIGSFAFAVILYMLKNNDWDLYKEINNNLLSFIFGTLPYLWIIFLIIFITLAEYNLKNTKSGYRYRLRTTIILITTISIFSGTLLYHAGLAQTLDRVLNEKIPIYQKLINTRCKTWSQPERGLLAGTITKIGTTTDFIIRDFSGNTWQVINNDPMASVQNILILELKVKMIGEPIADQIFNALKIRPYFPNNHINLPPQNNCERIPLPMRIN